MVPAHWAVEVTNALLTAVRRGRVTEAKAQRFVEDLGALPIRIDTQPAAHTFSRVFELGQQLKLTSYDAAYLELAVRSGLPLATLDEQLRKAAVATGVALSETG